MPYASSSSNVRFPPIADIRPHLHREAMTQDTIAEVGIDQEHRLFVRPSTKAFPFIWRAAMEVNWDEGQKRLFSPKPREWTYVNWFNQIIWAAADEYGTWLRLTPDTIWSGISDELRAEMESGPLPPIASRQG